MDLIRLTLMQVEGEEPIPDMTNYSEEQRVYHSALLIEAGLVDGNIVEGSTGFPEGTVMRRLTWAGHEFLDAVREDSIWNKVKQKVIKPGASWTFGLLVEYAKAEIKHQLFPPDAVG